MSTRGAVDDQQADAGYTVEIAIPWQAFSSGAAAFAPPELGEAWRANLFVLDMTLDRHRGAAWSPVGIADFHVPQRFGILIFEGSPKDMLGKNEPSTLAPARLSASGAAPAASGDVLGLESPGSGH